MKTLHDLKIGLDDDLAEQLQWLSPGYNTYRVVKKSVDARQRHNPHFVYSVDVYEAGETPPEKKIEIEKSNYRGPKPLIIGSGPAGLFAALRFVERGIPCQLFERGSECVARMKGINRFWRYGELDAQNNVCFGEGGAGLYSDGKLITRIKSPHIQYVMNRLVRFGAPEEIEYLANPHVGSDRIRRVIPKMREFLIANGCEIFFDTPIARLLTEAKTTVSGEAARGAAGDFRLRHSVVGVETSRGEKYHSDKVILATGHSADDVFNHLEEIGVFMEGKSFAVGLRIEHPQKVINQIQFRDAAEHPALGAANYKLAHHDKKTDIGVYSFCMCPGGYVLSSGTSANGIVCNGMSNYKRNSPFANAAIVFTVDHERTFGGATASRGDGAGGEKADVWAGMRFRQELEENAFKMVQSAGGTKEIPVQRLTDFMNRRAGPALESSTPSGVKAAPLHELFSKNFHRQFVLGLEKFGQDMKGFLSDEAQLHAVESRTSCPIRVTRDAKTLESVSHGGLFPCGEGAGYAGGITSAACDGIRIADQIAGF